MEYIAKKKLSLGGLIRPGEEVALTEEQAERLLERRAVAPAEESPREPEPEDTPRPKSTKGGKSGSRKPPDPDDPEPPVFNPAEDS